MREPNGVKTCLKCTDQALSFEPWWGVYNGMEQRYMYIQNLSSLNQDGSTWAALWHHFACVITHKHLINHKK